MELVLDVLRIDIWPLGLVILGVLLVVLWRRTQSLSALLCLFIFGIYLLFAVDRAFFPIAISGSYADEMRKVERVSSFINLIPFNFNFSEIPDIVFRQIFQNVLLTVPFGFGVSFVARLRAKDFAWLIPVIGFGIETMQVLISLLLRYPYRVIDINDALLNTLGVLIGYGSFRIFAWFYVWVVQRLGIKYRGLAAYIYDVASRASMRPEGQA